MHGIELSKNSGRKGAMLLAIAGLVMSAALLAAGQQAGAQARQTGSDSGLPLPRFVSIKSERVNMRVGPGREFEVDWLYLRRGLPLEIIQEYDKWRKVRDWEGSEGWVLHSLLSGERSAIVAPWDDDGGWVAMRAKADKESPLVAELQPRVIGRVEECEQGWCRIDVKGMEGYVPQNLLWGVYPGEDVKE